MINFPKFRLWKAKSICVKGQCYKIVKYNHAARIGAVKQSEAYRKHYAGIRIEGRTVLPLEPIVRSSRKEVIECILRIHSKRYDELINQCRAALSAEDPKALENGLTELISILHNKC
ncbi:MAG: hypothetical protein PHD66_09270 [Eubacteriales bacterium]|nr:hypothetical protein [Eubacteriales bacterium]